MDNQRYFAGDPLPRPRLPKWELRRCLAGGWPIEATILSTSVYPVYTHFDGTTRVLCSLDYCPPEIHKKRKQWCGYFQAIVTNCKYLALLEVTEGAYVQLQQMVLENGGSFRGMRIKMARRGESKQAPVAVDLLEVVRGVHALPEEVDMWPMILKLFKAE